MSDIKNKCGIIRKWTLVDLEGQALFDIYPNTMMHVDTGIKLIKLKVLRFILKLPLPAWAAGYAYVDSN